MESSNQRNCLQFWFTPRKWKFWTFGRNPVLEKSKRKPQTHWRTTLKWRTEKNREIFGEKLKQRRQGIWVARSAYQKQIIRSLKQPYFPWIPRKTMPAVRRIIAKTNPRLASRNTQKNQDDLAAFKILQFKWKNFEPFVQNFQPSHPEMQGKNQHRWYARWRCLKLHAGSQRRHSVRKKVAINLWPNHWNYQQRTREKMGF